MSKKTKYIEADVWMKAPYLWAFEHGVKLLEPGERAPNQTSALGKVGVLAGCTVAATLLAALWERK